MIAGNEINKIKIIKNMNFDNLMWALPIYPGGLCVVTSNYQMAKANEELP